MQSMSNVAALVLSLALPFALIRVAPAVAATPSTTFENGSDLRLVHVTNNVAEAVAFGPDGSAYSITRGSAILRVAPNGARTLISYQSSNLASPGAQIVYSNGFLWFQVHQGLERVKPDGTDGRYYAPPDVTGERSIGDLTAGPNGIYYRFNGPVPDQEGQNYFGLPELAEISNTFVKTYIPLTPVEPAGRQYPFVSSIAAGPGGSVYFEEQKPGAASHLARVDASGTVTVFKDADLCGNGGVRLVYARGAFYFIAYQNASSISLCRVSLTGFYAKLLTIAPLPNYPTIGLTADAAGDLWTSNFFGTGLYSYAIGTGTVSGPYDPAFLSNIFSLYTSPDQNIYFYGHYASNQLFFGAYLRHQLAFEPNIISLYSADPSMDFYVTESLPSAPWTAVSLNPAVATVVPSSSLPGRFTVTETGIGTTSIAVTDRYGTTKNLSVIAN